MRFTSNTTSRHSQFYDCLFHFWFDSFCCGCVGRVIRLLLYHNFTISLNSQFDGIIFDDTFAPVTEHKIPFSFYYFPTLFGCRSMRACVYDWPKSISERTNELRENFSSEFKSLFTEFMFFYRNSFRPNLNFSLFSPVLLMIQVEKKIERRNNNLCVYITRKERRNEKKNTQVEIKWRHVEQYIYNPQA